jgi:hypothetical protein
MFNGGFYLPLYLPYLPLGLSFIAVVRFGSTPTPSLTPLPSINSTGDTHRKTEKSRQLADGRGVEGGGHGAE